MAPPRSVLSRILDSLEGQQKQAAKMQSDIAVLIDDRADASAQRDRTEKKIEQVGTRVGKLEGQFGRMELAVDNAQKGISEIKVYTDDYAAKRDAVGKAIVRLDELDKEVEGIDQSRQRVIGGFFVVHRFALIVGSIAAGAGMLIGGFGIKWIFDFVLPKLM